MSTAGKVLTVLILLVMLGWVVMISAVTQLNVNWQERIAKQDKEFAAAEAALAKANQQITDFTESARVEQVNTDRDFREIQSRIFAAERRQTVTSEFLLSLKLQVADYMVAAQRAQTNLPPAKPRRPRGSTISPRRKMRSPRPRPSTPSFATSLPSFRTSSNGFWPRTLKRPRKPETCPP